MHRALLRPCLALALLAACRDRAASPGGPPLRAAVAPPRAAPTTTTATPPTAQPPAPRVPWPARSTAIADMAVLYLPGFDGPSRLLELNANGQIETSPFSPDGYPSATPDGWMTLASEAVDGGTRWTVERQVGTTRTRRPLPAEYSGTNVVALRDGRYLFGSRERRQNYTLDGDRAVPFNVLATGALAVFATADGVVWGWRPQDPGLLRRNGTAWEPVTAGQQVTWTLVASNADDPVAVFGGHRAMRYDAGTWREVALGLTPEEPVAYAAVGPDGTVVVAHREGLRLVTVTADGARTTVDLTALGVAPGTVRSLARDGRGRTWAATSSGLVVLDAANTLLRWYAPRTNDPPLEDTTIVLVVGRGPSTLPRALRPTGVVRGQVMADGQPVAGAEIELCESLLGDLGTGYTSPCDPARPPGEEVHPTRGVTGPDGRFMLVGVPSADVGYWFAVRAPHRRWANLDAPSVDGNDVGDRPVDAGVLRLPAERRR